MPMPDFNQANASLDGLPPEILMHIVSYLEPKEIAKFQRICKALLRLGRDNGLWLEHCFERSSMYESVWLPRLQEAQPASGQNETTDDDRTVAPNTAQGANEPPEYPGHLTPHLLFLWNAQGNIPPPNQAFPPDPNNLTPTMVLQLAAAGNLPYNTPPALIQQAIQHLNTNFQLAGGFMDDDHVGAADPDQDGESDGQGSETSNQDDDAVRNSKQERVRIRANWDPSYPNEEVSWYNEYIHRHAPTVVNWFEPARRKDAHRRWVNIEARGLALYHPDGHTSDSVGQDTVLAISPLDDGGICIWDVNGTRGKKGSIFAKSNPGLLFVDGPQSDNSRASKRVDSGVTECVSVDNQRHRAFFAVQSHLIDVDLQTMSVVGCESFPWSITALSPADATVPLTIATSLGIHLHDYKSRPSTPVDYDERVDGFSSVGAQYFYEQGLRNLFTDVPLPPYAPLSQPGPLSILHLQEPGSLADLSDDIYVAGRFSNILHYDRRSFPSIKDSIYSGGSLCSMTSSPYPFSALCSERRRRGQMSVEEVEGSKSLPGGRALIACGEYNTKGTLEIYGLSPSPDQSGKMEITGHQNRYTASGAKLLSVVNHGARIAVSDGLGCIRWFERDGFTEIRCCRIAQHVGVWDVPSVEEGPMVSYGMETADEIARKILPAGPAGCGSGSGSGRVNDNDLLFWTGDKVGSVGFTTAKGTVPEDFLAKKKVSKKAGKEKRYAEAMRTALAHQADEARWFDWRRAGHD